MAEKNHRRFYPNASWLLEIKEGEMRCNLLISWVTAIKICPAISDLLTRLFFGWLET